MNLSFFEVCHLKHICVKAQQFELAAKFMEEEKCLWAKMSKKQKQAIVKMCEVADAQNGTEVEAKVNIPFPISMILDKVNSKLWTLTSSASETK